MLYLSPKMSQDNGLDGPEIGAEEAALSNEVVSVRRKFSRQARNPTHALGVQRSTLFVRNLAPSFNNAELTKLFSDIGPVKNAYMIKKKGDTAAHRGMAFVQYAMKSDADAALQKFNGLTVKKYKLNVELARQQGYAAPGAAPVVESGPAKQHPTMFRDVDGNARTADPGVLVTGIPVEHTENDFGRLTSDLGASIVLYPSIESNADENCARIQFPALPVYNTAMSKLQGLKCNGVVVKLIPLTQNAGRLIVRNLHPNMDEKTLQRIYGSMGSLMSISLVRKPDGSCKGFGFVTYARLMDADKALQLLNGKTVMQRQMIVDWTLPKHRYEDSKKRAETNRESKRLAAEQAAKAAEEKKQLDEKAAWAEEAERRRAERDARKAERDNRTVFVRGLAFATTKEAVQLRFNDFGPCVARIVLDKHFKKSRGQAFVEFRTDEAVQACLDFCDVRKQRHNGGIKLGGRQLKVAPTLKREQAAMLGVVKQLKWDKRNLHLAREGHIEANTEAAEGVAPKEMSLRLKQFQQTQDVLKNSNFTVSRTRLRIGNMPRSMDSKQLKALCLKTATTGQQHVMKKEVKAALKHKDMVNAIVRPLDYAYDWAWHPQSARIKQAIVVRDRKSGKVDPETNLGRSLQFGFVEFARHVDALACLRELNNNPTLVAGGRRLMVAFATEDARKNYIREMNTQKGKNFRLKQAEAEEEGYSVNKAGKLNWKDRKLKKKRDKQVKKQAAKAEREEAEGAHNVESAKTYDRAQNDKTQEQYLREQTSKPKRNNNNNNDSRGGGNNNYDRDNNKPNKSYGYERRHNYNKHQDHASEYNDKNFNYDRRSNYNRKRKKPATSDVLDNTVAKNIKKLFANKSAKTNNNKNASSSSSASSGARWYD